MYYGWLLFFLESKTLSIRDPISGDIFKLPPLKFNENTHDVDKVMISRDPSLGFYEILVTYKHYSNKIAYMKSGDQDWIYSKVMANYYLMKNFKWPNCVLWYD